MTLLGPETTSSARLSLAQGFNSLGTVLAPILIGLLITPKNILSLYIYLAIAILGVALFFTRLDFTNFYRKSMPQTNIENQNIVEISNSLDFSMSSSTKWV